MKNLRTKIFALALVTAGVADEGRFESLGIPVCVGGLMVSIVGPNGRGSDAI